MKRRAANRLVVLEFNELTPSLMDRFIADGDLPTFKRFRNESRVFLTEAEERAPYLEPWIQWVTVHSGLNYQDHGIFNLNEGHKLTAPRTWDVLSERGYRVWVCGSMNAHYEPGLNGCALPDPWCTKMQPHPEPLSLYFNFVQQHVLEHSNTKVPITKRQYLEFLSFMAQHGLSAYTIRAILAQLLEERRADTRWKRAVLLDLLQYDVFRHYYRKMQPDFATFFLNSTAHFQHAYWDSMEPEEEQLQYREAIRFGYKQMDALLARIMAMVGPDTTLILCTALSQQAWVDHDTADGGSFYRPQDFERFKQAVGITKPCSSTPVMSEQFFLEFQSDADAEESARTLRAVRMGPEAAFEVRVDGPRVFAGCRIHTEIAPDARLCVGDRHIPFFDLFYKLKTTKSGQHNPEGLFWIREPDRRHTVAANKVPLGSVAPTILQYFGVPTPAQMKFEPVSL
jgi:hypothetical protein